MLDQILCNRLTYISRILFSHTIQLYLAIYEMFKYPGVPVLWSRVCSSPSILLYMCCHFRVLIDTPTKSAKIMADIIHHILSVILCSKTYHTFVKNRSGHMPISCVCYMIIVEHCKGLTALLPWTSSKSYDRHMSHLV